jgi:hypothetical protein
MAEQRERPYTGSNFLVSIGEGDGRAPAAGFAEVVSPPFVDDRTREASAELDPRASHVLVLRRGVTGSPGLHQWWNETRRAPARGVRKTVTVQLLAEDHATVVLTWRYSPLRAMDGGVLLETVELAFHAVEMA